MTKKESTIDWELLIMGLIVVVMLWGNILTKPDEVELSEVVPEEKVITVEIVEEVAVEETIDNYSSGNQQGVNKELNIDCPTCGVHLKVEEIENKQ